MRKFLLLSLLAVGTSLCMNAASEKIISDYLMGFEGFSGVSDFPPGWEVVSTVPEGTSTSFKYTIEATGGQQTSLQAQVGTARLAATTSQPSNGAVYLVSPPLNGKVKFATRPKSYSEKGPLKIFIMEKNENGDLVPGEELKISGTVFSSNFSWDSTLPYVTLNTYARIGIMLGNGYIDNIQADHALVPEYSGLMIEKSAPYFEPTGDICADSEGYATFSAKVNLLNYGTVDLESGIENYTVSLVRKSDDSVICSTDITESVPAGHGATLQLEFFYNLADPSLDEKNVKLCLREGISGSESDEKEKTFKAYVARLAVKDGTTEIGNGTRQHLGLIDPGFEKTWGFSNAATAPLIVSELTLPEGVTCSHELPVTIAPGASEDFTFTFNPSDAGIAEGSIAITHNGNALSTNSISYRFAYAGEGVYAVDCSDGVPAAWNNGADKKNSFSINKKGNNSYLYAPDYDARIVTPKVTLSDGEYIAVGISRENNYSWKEQYVRISYSSDRENWTEVLDFSSTHQPSEFEAGSGLESIKYVELRDIPAGDWYMAFDSKNGIIDDFFGGILTPGIHDIMLGDLEVPEQGMVNYPVTVKAALRNAAPTPEPAQSWTLSLISGNKTLATLDGTKDLNYSSAMETFDLTFTPHEAVGEMPLSVVFDLKPEDGKNQRLEFDAASITIVPEAMTSNVEVGTIDAWTTSSYAPFTPNYNNSVCEMVYKADQLGLKEGDVINRITYYYQQSSDKNNGIVRHLKLWLDNTEASAPTVPDGQYGQTFADTVSMRCVYQGSIDFTSKTDPQVAGKFQKLELQLSEPFTYNGQNLRVICRAESNTYISSYIAAFSSTGSVVYWAKDKYDDYKNINYRPSTDGKLPCMELGLTVTAPEVSGKLLSGSTPLSGAKVFLRSDDVLYSSTTDEEGAFNVAVLQPQREYELTAAAPAHVDVKLEAAKYDTNALIENIVLNRNNLSDNEYSVAVDEENSGTIYLEWAPLSEGSMDDMILYNVYLDDELMAENLTQCDYTLTNVADGIHDISVKAVFFPSMLDHVLTRSTNVSTAVSDLVVNGCDIHATAEGAVIYSSQAGVVLIYDLTGRTVTHVNVAEGKNPVRLERGTYVVRLTTPDRQISRKIQVK